ncbi:MAG: DUF4388 domain-containing protein [Nitrospirota bacterium]
MALEGSLRDFGLADILQLIFFQRKTGILGVEGKMDTVRLFFIDGNITGAESKRRTDANRLGKVLVKRGLLEEKDLQAVLEEQRRSDVKLGTILMKRGIVPKEEIEEILSGQVKETVIQLFGWKEGTYEFTPQAIPVDKNIPISLDTQHLLMEGLRIVDEWALIEGKITLDSVFSRKAVNAVELTAEEEEIYSLVDGENDVSTIIDISGKDDFTASKMLVSLMERGFIELKEDLAVFEETPLVEEKRLKPSYHIFPLLVIAVALVVSFSSVFMQGHDIFKKFFASRAIDDLGFKVETYKLKHGVYPDTLRLISDRVDPWGNPFIYEENDNSYTVLSSGPDGERGTPDDIY